MEHFMISCRRAEAQSEPWRPHPVLESIADDDPELEKILRGITKPAIPMPEIVEDGPFRRTQVYEHAGSYDQANDDIPGGLLRTFAVHGRRFAYALDYAKYLLALKRLGEQGRGRDYRELYGGPRARSRALGREIKPGAIPTQTYRRPRGLRPTPIT